MILLDTDHLSVLTDARDQRHDRLKNRVVSSTDVIACPVVTIEETLRGWLAFIHRLRDVHRQLPAYRRLAQLFDVVAEWEIVPFDEAAADGFVSLRKAGIRIGTMDLKIASIALANDALLLTANVRDFEKVLKLRIANWLE